MMVPTNWWGLSLTGMMERRVCQMGVISQPTQVIFNDSFDFVFGCFDH